MYHNTCIRKKEVPGISGASVWIASATRSVEMAASTIMERGFVHVEPASLTSCGHLPVPTETCCAAPRHRTARHVNTREIAPAPFSQTHQLSLHGIKIYIIMITLNNFTVALSKMIEHDIDSFIWIVSF